jgi:methylase of polypeptide subunit release factors
LSGADSDAEADAALLELLRRLDEAGYDFVTPTPLTHARVLARRGEEPGRSLRDILGWSLPFERSAAPKGLEPLLARAGALIEDRGRLKSAIRVSRLRGRLFIHSAYPTEAEDSVFFGPDSYRFADFVARTLPAGERGAVLDVGGGCGPGAITAADAAPAARVRLSDVNPQALRYARLAARHAGLELETAKAEGLAGAPEGLAVVLANPPYMAASSQTYRDGGDMHGARISVDWAQEALGKLAPGGRIILYTGSAILEGGRDELRGSLEALARAQGAAIAYSEIDPDVFGEELEREAYRDAERIAAVGCVITRP